MKLHLSPKTPARNDQENSLALWIIFFFWWAVVWIVSAVDVYWSIYLGDTLHRNELNPIGRWLIALDNGNVALFMAVKFLGTTFVLAILPLIFIYRKDIGYAITCGLGSLMCGLFYFLYWG